jgi:hypothetical protein
LGGTNVKSFLTIAADIDVDIGIGDFEAKILALSFFSWD